MPISTYHFRRFLWIEKTCFQSTFYRENSGAFWRFMFSKPSPFSFKFSKFILYNLIFKIPFKSKNWSKGPHFICCSHSTHLPDYRAQNKRKKAAHSKMQTHYFKLFYPCSQPPIYSLLREKIRRRFGGSCFLNFLRLPSAVPNCFHRNS